MSILFTCIGRRVSLLNSFRKAARQLKIKVSFFGTDTTELSPALQCCDKGFRVKPIQHPGYIRQLLSIVKNNHIRLLVPTVDPDLKLLAGNNSKFAALGCRVLVSSPEVLDICQDKRQTYQFLVRNHFETPVTMSVRSALSGRRLDWPCFLKPWDGSASKGNAVVHNQKELEFYAKRIPNPICQEFVRGDEFTCDVYVDFAMKVRCVVPRKRIETRAGEVSKSQVLKDRHIMNQAASLVETLGAGPGLITLQLFKTTKGQARAGKLRFIEINPRFGGGVPLSIAAGANFPKWILQELLGKPLKGKQTNGLFEDFKDSLVMLRYDSEVWLENPKSPKV